MSTRSVESGSRIGALWDFFALDADRTTWREVQLRAKRIFDVAVALVLLLVLLPILAVVAVAVKIDTPGPLLFGQKRIGRDGRAFTMWKFRTMVHGNDQSVHKNYYAALVRGEAAPINGMFKLVDDPRVTPVGRILRRFSLDEFPQLLNVLRGDMSLVGPRPPLAYEVELYGPRECQRLQVTPGLTGLWQVSGRNKLGFQEMIDLDLAYIAQWSLWLDVQILVRTPLVVLTGWGAS